MSKNFNNKLYYPLLLVLFGLVSSLNASPKLLVCACVYVFIALTVNAIAELYSKKEAMICLLGSIALYGAFTLKSVSLILLGSFFAVIVSAYCGASLSAKLKPTTSFHARNFIALLTASMIDSMIMPTVLLMKFSAAKCLSIALNDMMYKSLYSIAIALSLIGVAYLIEQGKKLTHVTKH